MTSLICGKRTVAFVAVKDRMGIARTFREGCGGGGMGSGWSVAAGV